MRPTVRTRKPVDQLTLSDFEAFPAWEWCLDEEDVPEQDETWVRPVSDLAALPSYGNWMIFAEFTMPGGNKHRGFVPITIERGWPIEVLGGVILNASGYHPIDYQSLPQSIGTPANKLFPVTYRLLAVPPNWSTHITGAAPVTGTPLST